MAEPSDYEVEYKPYPEEQSKKFCQLFRQTLNKLRCDKTSTDVILVCGDQEIPAHKLILEAASPFFRNVFKNNFKESVTNQVTLDTVSPIVMNIILDFMYLGSLSELMSQNTDVLIDVFKASHYLLMEPLSALCLSLIITQEINCKNYLIIWDLCIYECDSDKVLERVLKFILQNFNTIANSDQFLDFSVDRLLQIMGKMKETDRPKENFILYKVLLWIKKDLAQRQSQVRAIFRHIKFDLLSREYQEMLIQCEPLIYEDEEILTRMKENLNASDVVPILKGEEIDSPAKIDDIIAYFFGLFQTTNKSVIHCIQKVNLKTGMRDKPIALPFTFHSGSACVMQKSMFYFVGGFTDLCLSSKTHFFIYDLSKNYCLVKPDLLHAVSCPQIVIDDEGIIYVCDARFYENENPLIQYFCEDEWQIIKFPVSKITVINFIVISKTVFILCKDMSNNYTVYQVTNQKCQYLFELAFGNQVWNYHGSFQTFMNVLFNGRWFVFSQSSYEMECLILEPTEFSNRFNGSRNRLDQSQSISRMPVKNWKIFARERSIIFFADDAVYEFFPDTWVMQFVSQHIEHNLQDEICSHGKNTGHIHVCLN